MSGPKRIQLRRTKGWRKPEGAIVVARPSRWGNWYVIERARTPERAKHGGFKRNGPWMVVATDKRGWPTGPQWGGFGEDKAAATAFAVELYRRALQATYEDLDGPLNREWYVGELRGHDLACWCPLDQPCHADVLLELANSGSTSTVEGGGPSAGGSEPDHTMSGPGDVGPSRDLLNHLVSGGNQDD